MELIKGRNLSYAYQGKTVLKNVDFSLEEGDFLCILGENGSGKSTLIKGILKMKKHISGEMYYNKNLVKNSIGYLPQYTSVQNDFPAKVKEVVLSGMLSKLKFRPFYSSKDKHRMNEIMKSLSIYELRNKSFAEISGGQRQRVLLARAICASNKILVLDEPEANLDPIVRKELYSLVEKINKEMEMAIIMVSHQVGKAVQYADKVLHLDDKGHFFGSKESYMNTDMANNFFEGRKDY